MPPRQKKPPEPCIVTGKSAGNRNGACAPCRARKVKCEWIETAGMCRKCLARPASQRSSQTRGSSLPPLTNSQTDNQPLANIQTASKPLSQAQATQPVVGQKRRFQSESNVGRQAKQSRTSDSTESREPETESSSFITRTSFTSQHSSVLDPIAEIDDEDGVSGHSRRSSNNNEASPQVFRTADTMVRVLQGSDSDKIDIESNDEGHASDDWPDETDIKQQRRPRYIKESGRRKGPKGGQYMNMDADVSSDEDDPKTCDFTIQSAVKGSDGSNIPFIIQSSVTLPDLRYTIASKLKRFPDHVQVRYKLESDKSKAATTTIQSEEELAFFIDRVRPLIVPQRLPSGKISTRVLKPVIVCFEDAGDENAKTEASGSKGNSKNTKKLASSNVNTTNPALVEEKTAPIVKELATKWRCDMHSVKDGKDVLCYREPHTKVCYQLTFQNLKYWALLIAGNDATIDEKPARLILDARDRTRAPEQLNSRSHSPHSDTRSIQSGSHNAQQPWGLGPNGYGYPMPFVVPPWMPPMCQPPALNMQAGGNALTQLAAPNLQPLQLAMTPTSTITKECLEIEKWFHSLEQDKERNDENILFSQYGAELKRMGFRNITQLSRDFITLQELQSWLEINAGTAVMILQYAQEDVKKYKANTTTRV
ncbi:hypothetical protein M378DRAFT_16057 [Amanita muscaria Koide BX008]|uniref:Uncharacterized protein n=1 Tax=Amanita muscaria (strain Koide BX008) TaxID=946122 RepID=A0A0C2WLU7_AMAMK|nr:hypothetical protein M378DRAFT_16057 [Amanita muscaria Koide BX008]